MAQAKKKTAKAISPQKNASGKKTPEDKKSRKIYFYPAALFTIIVLGIIVYSNSFNCSFHFDDADFIVNNSAVHHLSDVKAWWGYAPSRGLGTLTFALNYHFNKLDVWGYHFINLMIHLINACLVFWLVLLIFSSPAIKDHPLAKQKRTIALFTALLFVSHPLATQSVTYIVQRFASLMTMFYLISLTLYVKARFTETAKKIKYLIFVGSALAAVAAMLTKENSFTLPFMILLFEFYFIRTKKWKVNFRDYRTYLVIAVFLGILAIVPSMISLNFFDAVPPIQGHLYTVTPFSYLLTQFSVISKYIQLLILPVNQMLEYDYALSTGFFELRTMLCFLLLVAIFILGIFLYKKNRVISFGIFWFFLALSIEASIIPGTNLIFEHRTYLPSIGFFLILGSVVHILFKGRFRYLTFIIPIAIIGIFSFMTFRRNNIWKDDLSLWSDNVSKAPNSVRAVLNRGVAYGTMGQWDKALADYSAAIRMNPNYLPSYVNRGIAYYNFQDWKNLVADYSKVIELDPAFTEAYYNRGLGYGHMNIWDKAIADFETTLKTDSSYGKAYYNLGLAYGNCGEPDKAIDYYSRAVRFNPRDINAYINRGVMFENLGKFDEAMADYNKALETDPGNTMALNNRQILENKLKNQGIK